MKIYKNPAMEIMCFSDEDIVTASPAAPNTGLAEWQAVNTNGQVVTKNVTEMSDMLKFTF